MRAHALILIATVSACGGQMPVARNDPAPAPVAQTGIDTRAIPYLTEAQRADVARDLGQAGNPDRYTLAVSRSGSWAVANEAGATPEQRRWAALARCQALAGMPCGLALVDGTRVPFVEQPIRG